MAHVSIVDEKLADPAFTRDLWRDGTAFLLSQDSMRECVAEFFGWPERYVHHLATKGLVSMPLHSGERSIGMLIVASNNAGESESAEAAAYQVLSKGRWHVVCDQPQQRDRFAGYPFVAGDLNTARLVVVTYGVVNALAFALAAGWCGSGRRWPVGHALVALRGDHGVISFLDEYGESWPLTLSLPGCLLLVDTDAPGLKWHGTDDSISSRLMSLGARVGVFEFSPHKNFSEMYRAQGAGVEQIAMMLDTYGFRVEAPQERATQPQQ